MHSCICVCHLWIERILMFRSVVSISQTENVALISKMWSSSDNMFRYIRSGKRALDDSSTCILHNSKCSQHLSAADPIATNCVHWLAINVFSKFITFYSSLCRRRCTHMRSESRKDCTFDAIESGRPLLKLNFSTRSLHRFTPEHRQ